MFKAINQQCDGAAKLALLGLFLVFPISTSLTGILMFLALLLWLAGGNWRMRWESCKSNPVVWAFVLMYGIILVGLVYTVAPMSDAMLHLEKYLKVALVVVWISLFMTGQDRIPQALNVFAYSMLFILLSTWLNIWFQLPWSETQNQGWGVAHYVAGDYITQNVMMAFFVLLALYRAVNQGDKWRSVLWLLVGLAAIISITHLSIGRTGFVLLAVSLLVFAATYFRGRYLIIALVLMSFLLIVLIASSEPMRARFILAVYELRNFEYDNTTSIGHRLYNFYTSALLFFDSPLIGHGTGAYHTRICTVIGDPNQCQIFSWHPHNQYLFFAVNHGLVGLVLYLSMLASMLWVGFKTQNQEAKVLLLGLTALLAVNSLFNSPLWSSRESYIFTLMGALLVSMASADKMRSSRKLV